MHSLLPLSAMLTLLAAAPATPQVRDVVAPAIPIEAVEGGVVVVQLSVAPDGSVRGVRTLRTTPPYEQAVVEAVSRWIFQPPGREVPVLVAALFRSATFPSAATFPATDLGRGSEEVPMPVEAPAPPYPANAVRSHTVILRVDVDRDGRVSGVSAVSGASPFVDVCEQTLGQWRFRPARTDGVVHDSVAYVVFAFREPVLAPPAVTPGAAPTHAGTP